MVTLRVGVRAKEGHRGDGEGRKYFFFLPAPSPLPLTRPISSSLREFQHGAFAIKTIRAPDENACTAGYLAASNDVIVRDSEPIRLLEAPRALSSTLSV